MPPSSTHAPLPSTSGEWHPSHTNFLYTSLPWAIIALLAVCCGGFGTGGIVTCGVGKGTVPLSLNASSRDGPRLDSGVAIVLAGANNLDPDPHPTAVRMYCSPLTENVTGTDWIADPVCTDHTFLPLSAE